MNEAMVVLVAAGMSVDYLLHMAHSYNHQHGTNKERTRKYWEKWAFLWFCNN